MRRWRLAVAVAVAWCALIVWVHRDSPRTLVSAHGLLHAAIAGELAPGAPATDGVPTGFATPPENPLFAGTPLPYYWFFHAVGARLAALLHVDVIHAFEVMVVAAAFAAVLAGFALMHWIFRDPRAVAIGGVAFATLYFAGCHPQGPLVLLARWWKHGDALFTNAGFGADGDYLWGLVHPANGALRIGDPYGTLGPLVTYYFNVTARPLALASLLLVFVVLGPALDTTRPRSWRRLGGLALAMGFCTLWSPLIGLASTAALSASLVVNVVAARRRRLRFERTGEWLTRFTPEQQSRLDERSRASARAHFHCSAALWIGALIASPWWWRLLASGGGGVYFGFNSTRALGMAASGWLVFLLAWRGPPQFVLEAGSLIRVVRLAGVLLALPTAFVALPVGNEDNFFHAALVCWSVLAASAVVPKSRRADAPVPPEGGG